MKNYSVNLQIVELEKDNFHTFITVSISGIEIRAIIDTGASHSCVDKAFVENNFPDMKMEKQESVNAGIGGSDFEVLSVDFQNLKIGDYLQNESETMAVIDFQHINGAYIALNIEPIQMILGNDFLISHKAIIDYSQNKLLFIK